MSTTLDQNKTFSNISCQLSCGVQNFVPKNPIFKHIMPVRLGCPQLWTKKKPSSNISCQLGWGVYNFGPKTPCTSISCQLGCGVHYLRPKILKCKHIMPVRLGCVHNVGLKKTIFKHIMTVRLERPQLWTKKNHLQTLNHVS